MVNSG